MIYQAEQIYLLHTEHTDYMFRVLPTGHLEHLYYGASLGSEEQLTPARIAEDADAFAEKRAFEPGNEVVYDQDHKTMILEDMRFEISSYGKGDIREPFLEIIHHDGSRTCDFLFDHAEICNGSITPLATMPCAYAEDDSASELIVTLKEAGTGLTLELRYVVFPKEDVITRSSRLINESDVPVRLLRLMSLQLDLEYKGYVMTTFNGAWAREMYRNDTTIIAGKTVNSSYTGSSSSRANPFVMLSRQDTTEGAGECWGFNLVYSGNHAETAEVNAYDKTRFLSGINPQGFSCLLEPGEAFEAPEAVMTYTNRGFRQLSHNMHHFVREHIVRGTWKNKVRPVLLNSWEAAYFKIDEGKLLKLAKAGADVGIELFVMDDGWFGKRNSDNVSLGDWTPDPEKLPGGLAQICRKINDLGMDFGIWVEPEMVSEDSDLYRAHPDWAMTVPGRHHSEGRNQMILDLANPEVVEYMTGQMESVFASAPIRYVKWDMNRYMSDVYSPYLPAERQGETAHRYILGLYRMMKALTEKFPDILFEGCAAGGNRFDLGILSYFPQIWASDDSDAYHRVKIQEGYSYGYPQSTYTAHVSASPNHQTLRVTPLETRFNVAAFGVLGYELNLTDCKKADLEEVKEQIAEYKRHREMMQFGDFYRGRSHKTHTWTVVAPDRKKAAGMIVQGLVEPNVQFQAYRAVGLIPEARYHFYNRPRKQDIRNFGDLINTASPIHVKQDSALQRVLARFVTMPGEKEDRFVSGAALMNSGVKLAQAFSATGYNEEVRYFQDFSSRMYYMDADEAH